MNTADPSTRFPLVAPEGSVLARQKEWTRTTDQVAELTALVERTATEQGDRLLAARIADAVTAERAAADTRERELLDAEYARLAPLLDRRTRPAYVEALIPQHVRERYETERSAV